MNQAINTDGYVEVGIHELRLRPGTELKMLDDKGNMLSHKAQFVAAFAGKSILLSLLLEDSRKIEIRPGGSYHLRGFTGKYDFSFTSSVLQIDDAQFNARLSCPDSVAVKFVRNHLRVNTSLAATISATGADNSIAVMVKDLSAGGAGIESNESLGSIGDEITLALTVGFERKKVNLNLTSIIRHATESDGSLTTGIEFQNTSQNDKLMLYYHVNTLSEAGNMN